MLAVYWALGVGIENKLTNPSDLSKRLGLRQNGLEQRSTGSDKKKQTTPTTKCCSSLKRFDWAAAVTEESRAPSNQLNVVRCLPLFLLAFFFSIITLAAREKALGFEPQPGLIVLPKSLAPGHGAAVLELLTWLAQAVVLDAWAPGCGKL